MHKTQAKHLAEFIRISENGCVPVTEWVSGTGRYASTRALPPFVVRVERDGSKYTEQSGMRILYNAASDAVQVLECAAAYFADHPRRRAVLVLDAAAYAKAREAGEL